MGRFTESSPACHCISGVSQTWSKGHHRKLNLEKNILLLFLLGTESNSVQFCPLTDWVMGEGGGKGGRGHEE